MIAAGELLARAADASADGVAFVDNATRRSYADLASDAGRLSCALTECGVGRGDRVGVALEGSYHALTALHAILDAGAVYVPLRHAGPQEQLAAAMSDSDVAALIDGRRDSAAPILRYGARGASLLDETAAHLPFAELEHGEARLGARRNRDSDLAYIFYTSGSTGIPKGVVHDHRSLSEFARWATSAVVTASDDRVAAATALTFDISLLEILAPSAVAATVVGIPRQVVGFPGAFSAAIRDARPTVLQLVPALWRGLLGASELLTSLRVGVVTGERMAPGDWSALRAAAPGARLLNVYGSAEVNDCACFELPADRTDVGEVPIGRPIAGAKLEILDPAGDRCPPDAVGELTVATPMLMRGYWRRAGSPDQRVISVDGRPAYRTGDLARRATDGQIYLVARKDRSVKIGGEWVHLDEVETVALEHAAVVEALALVDDAEPRRAVRLIVAAKEALDPADLKRHCAARLASPARPRHVDVVDRLARNSHGKVEMAAPTNTPAAVA